MNSDERAAVRAEVVSDAEEVIENVERRWDDVPRLDPLSVTPLTDRGDDYFPESAAAFREEFYPYAAGAVVTDDQNRLLCVYSPARDEWETPGGAGEPGEVPAETARRETFEETGVECEITDALFVHPMELDLGIPETLPIPVVVFTGRPIDSDGELSGAEIESHEEITDLTWFDAEELPRELRDYEQKYEYLKTLTEN